LLEHLGHVLLCWGIPWCLPFSILRECADKRSLVKCFLISMLFITDKQGGGYGFLFRSEICFQTKRVRIFIFFVGQSSNFFSRI
jgi:hypothetical protein